MKFIHAADIHLDSPLTGLGAYGQAAERPRNATREAFANLIDAALEREADFLIIAGDLYDGPWKDYNTGVYFCRHMGRLHQAGIPVFLLFGNHDAESEMTKKLELPPNVHIFDARKPATFKLDGLKTALHGQSFRQKEITANLAAGYPPPVPGFYNIGVLHTALGGYARHANYAPCALAELQAKGYDYWALGHVHERQIWPGPPAVAFPGNLQGRHAREPGPRGALWVELDDAGAARISNLEVDVLRWGLLGIDVAECRRFADVINLIRARLEATLAADDSGKPLALRIELHGATPAHGELFGLEAQLRAEAQAAAESLNPDRLWLEKVKIRTASPNADAAIAARADALSDMQELLIAAESDPEFVAGLQAELLKLVNKAPLELQTEAAYFQDVRAGQLAALIGEARSGLLAHLAAAE